MAQKAIYKSVAAGLTVEFEYGTQVALFTQLADFQSVFEESKCGSCQSVETKFFVRETKDGDKYYEKKCSKCGCALSYGQNKVGGTLYPKYKDADGNWDNVKRGWKKWTLSADVKDENENPNDKVRTPSSTTKKGK